MLVGKKRRPLFVGEEIHNRDDLEKLDRFRKKDVNDRGRREDGQEAA